MNVFSLELSRYIENYYDSLVSDVKRMLARKGIYNLQPQDILNEVYLEVLEKEMHGQGFDYNILSDCKYYVLSLIKYKIIKKSRANTNQREILVSPIINNSDLEEENLNYAEYSYYTAHDNFEDNIQFNESKMIIEDSLERLKILNYILYNLVLNFLNNYKNMTKEVIKIAYTIIMQNLKSIEERQLVEDIISAWINIRQYI